MSKLEELLPSTAVRGVLPDSVVTVVSVQWFGSEALELTYKSASGSVANELIYRYDEARLEVVEKGRPWSFDGDVVQMIKRVRGGYSAILLDVDNGPNALTSMDND